ncbi:DUF5134 domain-containing protein [Mycolicibacterium senegalense]|uniref:Integral membrane protein n=1 Tax=Mycolicibacterium senegalense TaxID=1796 RepID=A0A378SYI9_9MYCO|nr:DUF5134 domain-containing protein [Mycolicibacterium senegalense]MCV7338570.1 DUF5134 domain-containing protein [Mycolicibacterium senegalense]MDR7289495.1 hypothetical protein [Mycolicibacterium senegalense]QZA26329.1 DUF5134 domain-containing protein [Mycolicibacterium senegalense]STZ53668.1 integral membrane protein [Mycolicibacterium senegalense]
MIADLTLRWVVTVLFALSAAECGYALVRSRGRLSLAVSQALHLTMAVAMLVMAWPRGSHLPTVAPMLFFLAATVWFAVGLVRSTTTQNRLVAGYHAAMMLAMVWMYAVMNGKVLPGGAGTMAAGGHHMAAMHPAGHHGGGAAMVMAPLPVQPPWIPALNWLLTIGFVSAAVVWLYQYFSSRQQPGTSSFSHFGTLCRAMMAAGMAIMFGVMV